MTMPACKDGAAATVEECFVVRPNTKTNAPMSNIKVSLLLHPRLGLVQKSATAGLKSKDRCRTYPQPWGVTSPNGQSPESFSTIWLAQTGVMTMPALTREAAAERRVTKRVVFMVVVELLLMVVVVV